MIQKYFFKALFLAINVLFISSDSFSADRYWVGNGTDQSWNSTSNWSIATGGAGGATVPGSTDVAIFDSLGTGNCNLNIVISISGINVKSNYPGVITHSTNTLTVGAGNALFSGGSFAGGSAAITFNGAFTISGTSFTSTTGILSAQGAYTLSSGSFIHNNGKFRFGNTATLTGSTVFYDLDFYPMTNATYTIEAATVFTVRHLLETSRGYIININTGRIDAVGDININNTYGHGGGTATIRICGDTTQVFTGNPSSYITGPTCKVTIDKPSGTLFLKEIIPIGRDFTYIRGNIDAITYSPTVSFTQYSQTITGSLTLPKVAFCSNGAPYTITIASGTILTVGTDLMYGGTYGAVLSGDTVKVLGNISLGNSGNTKTGGGSGKIHMCGTTDQTIKGYDSTNTVRGSLPHLIIDKPSGTLYLKNTIAAGSDWLYLRGTMNTGSYTVIFWGNKTISGSHTLNKLICEGYAYTLSSGTILTVEGELITTGTSALTFIGGTVEAKGNITLTNTFNGGGGTGTLKISGNKDQVLSGSGSFSTTNALNRLPNVIIEKGGGILSLTNSFTVVGNWTYLSGNVNAGSSTVYFIGTKTISGTHKLFNAWFYGSNATYTIPAGNILTIDGELRTNATAPVFFNTGTIEAKGNINIINTYSGGGGTATLKINGDGDQVLSGPSTVLNYNGRLPHVIIDKPTGKLVLSNWFTVAGNWTYLRGTVDAVTNNSTVNFFGTKTISGSHSLNNILFYGGINTNFTIASGTTLTVLGELKTNGTAYININTGIVEAKGNITLTNTYAGAGGTALLRINGENNQILTGSGIINAGRLCHVEISKTGGVLSMNSIISIAGNLNYISGTVDATTNQSTVAMCFTGTVDAEGGGSSMSVYNFNAHAGTIELLDKINVLGNLTVTSTLTTNNHQVSLGGNWTNNGTFNYGTGKVLFNGSAVQTINKNIGTQIFNILETNKPSGTVDLNYPVTVNNSLVLTSGAVKTTATNILSLVDNATITGGNNTSYVSGPMKKTGNDGFTFPLGSTILTAGQYHPLSITAPSAITDEFTAEYLAAGQALGTILGDSLNTLSNCEYWSLTRNAGTSSVIPTLGYNSNTCNISEPDQFTAASWSGTQWENISAKNIVKLRGSGSVEARLSCLFNTNVAHLALARKTCYANAGIDMATCLGTAAQLSGSGGNSYSWSPVTGLSASNISNPTANPAITTTYTLTATIGANSCTDQVVLTINSLPVVNAGRDTTIEKGTSVVIGDNPTASGGVNPYQYTWSPSQALSSITIANPTCSTLTSATYIVLVKDANLCERRDTINVTVGPVSGFTLDFSQLSDTRYRVVALRIDTICSTQNIKKFNINNIAAVVTIELNPLTGKSCVLQFNIDSLSAITNVKWKDFRGHIVSGFISLDTALYKIEHFNSKLKLVPVSVSYKHEIDNETVKVFQFENSYSQNTNWKVFPGNYKMEVGSAPFKVAELELNFNHNLKKFETNTAGWRDGDNSSTSDFIFFDHGFLENRNSNEFAIKGKLTYFNQKAIDNGSIKLNSALLDTSKAIALRLFPGDYSLNLGDSTASMKLESNRSGELSNNILYSIGGKSLYELLNKKYYSIIKDTIFWIGDSVKVDITTLDNPFINIASLKEPKRLIDNTNIKFIRILPGSYDLKVNEFNGAVSASVKFNLLNAGTISNPLWKKGNDAYSLLSESYFYINTNSISLIGKSIGIDMDEAPTLSIFNYHINQSMTGGKTYWLFPGVYSMDFTNSTGTTVNKLIEVKQ